MRKQLKKGDEVIVISGSQKGKRGKILQVVRNNQKIEWVIIEGLNFKKHHLKKSQSHPEGTIIEKESKIHMSNIKPVILKEKKTDI